MVVVSLRMERERNRNERWSRSSNRNNSAVQITEIIRVFVGRFITNEIAMINQPNKKKQKGKHDQEILKYPNESHAAERKRKKK